MKKILLLSIIILLGCKENKVNKNERANETTEIGSDTTSKDNFQLVMDLIEESDDVYEVYYYELGSSRFRSKDFISKTVIGSNNSQTIIFDLPEHMYPERLRLDFGKKPSQTIKKLNSIRLIYGSKEYNFSKEEIINQFKPSKFMIFNNDDFTIKTKEIDDKYDPYFYSPKLTGIVNYLLED